MLGKTEYWWDLMPPMARAIGVTNSTSTLSSDLAFKNATAIAMTFLKAEVGFEPTNHGFAIRSLSPLGHSAIDWTGYFGLIGLATHTCN